MTALLEGFRALGIARLAALGAVALAMATFLTVLMLRGGSGGGRMALLYADLDLREAAQIAESLDAQHIAHEIGGGGGQIMVPEDQVGAARLLLARQGLPSGGSVGYELFDKGDSLTASQFQQQINQARALEGELARTIRGIVGIRAARVHLVLPKREPFAREQQEAQASVMLTMAGVGRLDREGVQAILNLVAAAVPGLRPQNIALVDSRGDVLARAGEPTGPAAAAQGAEEVRHATETRLSRAVEDMLEKSLGHGRVRAEAAVDMDFAQLHETQEKYDPEGQVVRSTQTVSDTTKSTEAAAAVTVQNNLPNADAGAAPGAGNQNARQEETTNYEIGKTVRTLVREAPEIRRISLAVMVDGSTEPAADGSLAWKPRSPEELDHIAALVRSAIGFDEKRGDKVEVVNLRFVSEPADPATTTRMLFGVALDAPMLGRLAQTGLVGVLALAALLLVLRPMVRHLTDPAHTALLAGGSSDGGPGRTLVDGVVGADGATLRIGHDGAPAQARDADGEDDGLIDVRNIEGQMRSSSLRRLSELVTQHPEESLSIVRAWMQREAS